MTPREERQLKLRQVRRWMRDAGLEVVFLTRRDNFSWLTAGSVNHVAMATEIGTTILAVTAKRAYILANTIEAPRMMAEEIQADEFTLVTFPWHCDQARRTAVYDLVGPGGRKRAASDGPLFDLPLLPEDFTALRYTLCTGEIARYKKLGRDVSEILETVGREISPGETEADVEALLGSLALARGIRPFVRLVAADRRLDRFRHPLATGLKIRRRVMFVIGGERHGLVIAATRIVSFGRVSPELRRKHQAVCNIETAMILSTRPGATLGEVLQAGIDAYAREGYPEQWELHHQGGLIGYAGREVVATPGEPRRVELDQAFAWNPSIAGTKSECTFLVTAKGPVNLSPALGWPTVDGQFGGKSLPRPDILVR
jgi:Xaa-Pro aminopeptidase